MILFVKQYAAALLQNKMDYLKTMKQDHVLECRRYIYKIFKMDMRRKLMAD